MAVTLFSCGSSDPLDVDVSEMKVQIEFERFEQEFAKAASANEMEKVNQTLMAKAGELYEFYIFDLLSVSPEHDSIGSYLWYFQNDPTIDLVNQDINNKFSDMSILQDRIIDMFKHLKYHLPAAPLPIRIVTYNSAFRYGVTSTSNQIGLGLDMYLGASNRNIEQLAFPQYMKAKMDDQFLPVDIANSWAMTNIFAESPGETFVSYMIYYGKLIYLVDAMMPDLEDCLKVRYTQSEYDFALASEFDVWQLLVDRNWIYSTEVKLIMRYFHDAPTTVEIEGSPDRMGQFMGWQMVKQYMEKNPEVTVKDLIEETNESKILKAYKAEEYE